MGLHKMKKYKVGYTQGTFDMFHIGHLNLIRNASMQCEKLIVGVNTDSLVEKYKKKIPIIPENDRREIVNAIRFVDDSILVDTLDKLEVLNMVKYDAIFIGDDWKGNSRWEKTKIDLAEKGIDVVFLKYTNGVSSTDLRIKEKEKSKE